VGSILGTFARRHATIDGIDNRKACLFGVNLLVEEKLIKSVVADRHRLHGTPQYAVGSDS
jgi:hypothetical protein